MNRKLKLFCALFLLVKMGMAQSYYPGNGLSISNDSFHLGGNISRNTTLKGKYGGTPMNFYMDTFGLLNYSANRIDLESFDSTRLISNKLIKLMSLSDIHLGATNAIVMDGNLWFKKYKKTNSNSGILTVDTCGRVSISTDITLNNYFKQGGNSFGSAANLGTNDENDVNFLVNGTNRLTLSASSPGANLMGGMVFNNSGTGYAGGPGIYFVNGSGHATGRYWDDIGLHIGNQLFNADGLSSYRNATNGSGTNYVDITISGEGVNNANGGNFTAIKAERGFYGSGRAGNFTMFEIAPSFMNNASDSGIFKGLRIHAGNQSDISYRRYRALEVASGKSFFYGAACIGCAANDTIHSSAMLEIKGENYDGRKGFLPPMNTTSQRGDIALPATGLISYNPDYERLEIKTSSGWHKVLTVPVDSPYTYARTTTTSSVAENRSSFVTRIGDSKTKTFTIQHGLNSDFVMVQFIDCGAEANCNLLLTIPQGARLELNDKNSAQVIFKDAPSFNRYKVMFLKVQ